MLIVIELPEVYEVGTLNMLSIQHPVHDQFSDERIWYMGMMKGGVQYSCGLQFSPTPLKLQQTWMKKHR